MKEETKKEIIMRSIKRTNYITLCGGLFLLAIGVFNIIVNRIYLQVEFTTFGLLSTIIGIAIIVYAIKEIKEYKTL